VHLEALLSRMECMRMATTGRIFPTRHCQFSDILSSQHKAAGIDHKAVLYIFFKLGIRTEYIFSGTDWSLVEWLRSI
jgi:hypothetical protein